MEAITENKTLEEQLAHEEKCLESLFNEYYRLKHSFKYGRTLSARMDIRGQITEEKKLIKELREKIMNTSEKPKDRYPICL